MRERERQAACADRDGARALLADRIAGVWRKAVAAAQEGRRHYLFAEDKLAYLEARVPGPFAAWWRTLAERLRAASEEATP